MGCDIHCYVEILDTDTFEWQFEDSYDLHRNYPLFGLLAMGVRVAYPFSFGIRGIPRQCSAMVRHEWESWRGAGHSPSYLTRAELFAKSAELLLLPDKEALEIRGDLLEFLEILGDFKGKPEHQRIVFWFDS